MIIKTTIELINKIDILFTQFFSSTNQTNLNDTLKYRYLNVVIKTHKNIIEEKIFQTIKKCKLDNVLKSNNISNKILKLLMFIHWFIIKASTWSLIDHVTHWTLEIFI
jgi:hypothetical protein